MTHRLFAILILVAPAALGSAQENADEKPIPIAKVERDSKVDFAKEILPIFRRNCLACHNSTDAESDLVLETPEAIRKGGAEGPSAVPGKGAESLLVLLASRQRESFMPPDDNDVGAKQLTPEELGLIQLWIDQGAEGGVDASAAIQWQPLPQGLNPILAAGLSPDGRYAAASRANQVFLYHVASQESLGRLSDPQVLEVGGYEHPGVAHLDLVQALAFSPDGEWIATGGFRVAKLWRKTGLAPLAESPGSLTPAIRTAVSSDGRQLALASGDGEVAWLTRGDNANWTLRKRWKAHEQPVAALAFAADGSQLLTASADQAIKWWNGGDEPAGVEQLPAPVLSLAVVGEVVAAGGADKLVRLLPLQPPAGEAPREIRELTGHGAEVTQLVAAGDELLSGSADGVVKRWNIEQAQELGQWSHGGPVTALAADADSGRAATAGADKKIRIWQIADGKQISEVEGDAQLLFAQQEATRAAELGKRRIDLAAADLKAGEDRLKAEQENQKKADEAAAKAKEDLAAKTEAAKQPQADLQAAEKMLAELKTQTPQVEEQLKAATEGLPAAQQAQQAAEKILQAAQAALEQATAADMAAAQAAAALAKATEALKDNQALAQAHAAAKTAAEAAAKAAGEIKQQAAAAEKDFAEKNAAYQKLASDQESLAKQLPELQAKLKTQEEATKKLAEAAKQVVEAMQAAERNFEGADRTAKRAAEAVQRAADEIPQLTAVRDQQTQTHQALVTAEQQAKEAYAASVQAAPALRFLDSGRLLAAVVGGRVQSWSAANGASWETYGDAGSVALLEATGGKEFVTVGGDGVLRTYDSGISWKLERTLGQWDDPTQFVDRVTALAFHPENPVLAVGGGEPSRSGQISLWNYQTGEKLLELPEPHSDAVFNLSFSRDGQWLASCAADRFVKVFRTDNGELVRAFEGHTHHVLDVAFNADGRELASSGADKVVKIWDALTGDQKRTISGFGKEVTSLQYLGDTNEVLVGVGDKSVHLKRTDNGGNVRSFGGSTDYVYAVGSTNDGKLVLAGGQDGVLRIWNDQGNVVAEFRE